MASFVDGLRNHMAENEHQANAKLVLDIIRKGRGQGISRMDLYRRVDNRIQARELSGIIANLAEAESIEIREEKPSAGTKGGRPRTTYVYVKGH